jgi:hypothetical protein
MVKSAPAMARVEPPLSVYLGEVGLVLLNDVVGRRLGGRSLRVEAVLTGAFWGVYFGGVGEGVVGPIHYGVLAEHGRHLAVCLSASTGLRGRFGVC